MNVWLIDDEQPCLDELAWQLSQYPDLELAGMETRSLKALETIALHPPDAVFLDIDMPKLDGLELALRIQERCPRVIVIFVTAHAQYALEAYKAHPLDFLLKPVKQARLQECVVHLRRQYDLIDRKAPEKRAVSIHCFGAFEMSCETEMKWGTRRVRALLLYLIGQNGAPVSRTELLDALFDGRNDKNTVHNLHMTIYRLKSLLAALDPQGERIRLTEENALSIAPGICDYTDFMRFARGNAVISEENAERAAQVLSLYRGAYLSREGYDWASESALEAEAAYERIALGLAGCHLASGRTQEAENVLTGLLCLNAFCEEAHTLLLDLSLEIRNRSTYLTRYEQYARILKNELGLNPAARYREHYERLKR